MRIFYYDRGQITQGSGIPDLPTDEEVPFIYTPGLKQTEPSIVGNELWRNRILHRFIDDGHEVIWGSRRRIMPSEDLDWDLQRLCDIRPEFKEWVRPVDPMLNCRVWDPHKGVEEAYSTEIPDKETRDEKIIPGPAKKWFDESRFGLPPDDIDLAIFHVMRANPIAGVEQSYMIGKFLQMGIPVCIYDNNRMLPGTTNSLRYWGIDIQDHPLVTLVAPFEDDYGYGKPHLIEFPYVQKLEMEPLTLDQRNGSLTYVGNEYDRWRQMERIFLPLATWGQKTIIWGKYDSKKGLELQEKYPMIEWKGRTDGSCRARHEIAHANATVNLLRGTYASIGMITYRTFDSPCYGTLQYADAKMKRIDKFVPKEYLASNAVEAKEIMDRIMKMGEQEYAEELERQRRMVRVYDFDKYFMPRYYELIDMAVKKAGVPA